MAGGKNLLQGQVGSPQHIAFADHTVLQGQKVFMNFYF